MIRKYFINGHTSLGHYSLLDQFWEDNDVWVVTGGSSKIQAMVFESFLEKAGNQAVEVFIDPTDTKTLEGMYFPESQLLVIGDKEPVYLSKRYPSMENKLFHLNDCLNETELRHHRSEIRKLSDEKSASLQLSYTYFKEGRKVHEEKEKIYLSAMNFQQADQVADELMAKLFRDSLQEESISGSLNCKRFFGAASAYGPVNFIDELTSDLNERVIIKGRSGSGKSTLMRKVIEKANAQSFSTISFPCALDPNSIDMVIIPQLSFCIVDGTAPHVINPDREGDRVVDMFERCMDQSVEVEYEQQLADLTTEYKEIMTKGTAALFDAYEKEKHINKYFEDELQKDKLANVVNQLFHCFKERHGQL
ncbi:hypothetical protein [Evansella halocellulosilytica]|uniref:hypothetical protein n=1 Tax=Evansella halocellulosilytica TaxID=2011013 RepID=UPI000BB7D92F|nr:hypothetical protein [Evansella halocellulosilytica]